MLHVVVPAESEFEQFSLEMKSVVQVTSHTLSSAKCVTEEMFLFELQKEQHFFTMQNMHACNFTFVTKILY